MESLVSRAKQLGSGLLLGCQVVSIALLIPWILTAVLIWLFPSQSYGLVQRWVCPVDSSIRIQETGGWLRAVLSDDEDVDFPQFTCVDARGAVVLRGDSGANMLAYLRVYGVVLLAILPIEVVPFFLIGLNARRNKTPNTAIPSSNELAARRLHAEIADLETERTVILHRRPRHLPATSWILLLIGVFLVVLFGFQLLTSSIIAEPINPTNLVGCILGLGALAGCAFLALRFQSAIREWDADHERELQSIDEKTKARTAELHRLQADGRSEFGSNGQRRLP